MPFKSKGKSSFSIPEEANGLKLVESLFEIPGVKQIHLFQNFLTVTHGGEISYEELVSSVEAVLRTRLPIHDPDFEFEDVKVKKLKKQHTSKELNKIEEILDRTVRPGLQADGGDLEVIEFKDNELKILYQGACGGCPSALSGTLYAIESILRQEMKNDKITVVPI